MAGDVSASATGSARSRCQQGWGPRGRPGACGALSGVLAESVISTARSAQL